MRTAARRSRSPCGRRSIRIGSGGVRRSRLPRCSRRAHRLRAYTCQPATPTSIACWPSAGETPGSQTVSDPGSQTVSDPGSQTVSDPDSQTVCDPDSQTVCDPGSQTVSDPGLQTVSDPVSQTVSDPVSQTVCDPVSQTVSGTRTAGTLRGIWARGTRHRAAGG